MNLDAQLWSAVVARDPSAGFLYAVTSTGIYCRPSCPSRRPRPDRVRFFERRAEAEAAGFRACLRCRPDRPDATTRLVEEVTSMIDRALAHGSHLPTLAELSARSGLSRFHLQRSFKAAVGLSPRGYAEARRGRRLKAALAPARRVDDAGLEAGYGSARALYQAGLAALGTTPARFLEGEVRYTTVSSELGPVLVARSERGLRAVELGEAAEETIRARWPGAVRDDGDPELRGWVEGIVAAVERRRPMPTLPLDVRATAFQWKVWRLLQATEPGQTLSYEELSARLGMSAGARAVARACASNPLALLVPCHRVVRKDGGLGGYRWGLARKAALLERERR